MTPVDLDALRERMATEGDLLGRLRARAAEYKEHDLHVTGDLLGEAADELALARAVAKAVEALGDLSHLYEYEGDESKCEWRNLAKALAAWRGGSNG